MAPTTNSSSQISDLPVVSVLCIMLVIILGAFACMARRYQVVAFVGRDLRTRFPERLQPGLGTEAVEAIPITTYSRTNVPVGTPGDGPALRVKRFQRFWRLSEKSHPRALKVAQTVQTCPICTEDFVDGEDVRRLPCAHIFHPPCIDPWLSERAVTCPLWYVNPSFSLPSCTNLLLASLSRVNLNVISEASNLPMPPTAALPRHSPSLVSSMPSMPGITREPSALQPP